MNIQEILPAGGLTEIKDDEGGTKRMSSSQVVMDCITHRSELRKHSLCWGHHPLHCILHSGSEALPQIMLMQICTEVCLLSSVQVPAPHPSGFSTPIEPSLHQATP